MNTSTISLFGHASSLKLTLFLFLILGVCVVSWHFVEFDWKNWLITLPLLLLALNLIGAILTNPIFKYQIWLLVFHIGLLLLLLVVAIGQVTRLIGEVEVTEYSAYDSSIVKWQQGVFHSNRLDQLRFYLADFSINYESINGRAERMDTLTHLTWVDELGVTQKGVVGDEVPLELHGYELYTTHNKGFAPVFKWIPNKGQPVIGSVHLPAWPAFELNQASDLQVPGTPYRIWMNLKFDDVILYNDKDSQFRVPKESVLVVRVGEERHELVAGKSIQFPTGRLEYLGLKTWMGFRIFYDWTLPWLLGAGLFAVFGLGLHFWKKYAPTPWLDEDKD